MKKLICNIKAIPFLIRTGLWIPHVYKEVETHTGIIIATDSTFRESDSLQHSDKERVYPRATITTLKCIYCGATTKEWYYKEPRRIRND